MWLAKSSMQTAITFSELAKETVTNYYGHFCQLVANMIDQTKLKIGGPGIEVEIDELKLDKRKYNPGRCVGDKSWVLRRIEKLYFCCHCARLETINTWTNHQSLHWERMHHYVQLLEGIQLHWKGWEWLQAHKGIFQFPPPTSMFTIFPPSTSNPSTSPSSTFQVNHSKHYKDPSTGTCTNKIEGKWNGLKSAIPQKNRGKHLSTYLFQVNLVRLEFPWRLGRFHQGLEGSQVHQWRCWQSCHWRRRRLCTEFCFQQFGETRRPRKIPPTLQFHPPNAEVLISSKDSYHNILPSHADVIESNNEVVDWVSS